MKMNELLVVGKSSFNSSKTGKPCYMLSVVHPDAQGTSLRAEATFVGKDVFDSVDCTIPALCEASYAFGGAISALKKISEVKL